jgi:hypothetical protein
LALPSWKLATLYKGRVTRQFGLCDCTKESVEYFCNQLVWPQQQLIVDVFDLFHKTSPSFHSSNISESLVNWV